MNIKQVTSNLLVTLTNPITQEVAEAIALMELEEAISLIFETED